MDGICVAREEIINAYKIVPRKSQGVKQHGDFGVDGRITLVWILEKQCMKLYKEPTESR
jgi:hypothetical protein